MPALDIMQPHVAKLGGPAGKSFQPCCQSLIRDFGVLNEVSHTGSLDRKILRLRQGAHFELFGRVIFISCAILH